MGGQPGCLLIPAKAMYGSLISAWSQNSDRFWSSAHPLPDDARALVVVAPLTSHARGFRGEVDIGKPHWLPKPSGVNI